MPSPRGSSEAPADGGFGRVDPAEGRTDAPAWCRWCGRAVRQPTGPGRPRWYCRQGCRQAAHVARKLADAGGLGPDRLVVDRREYEALMDRIATLRAALADLDRWNPVPDDVDETVRALGWVVRHAREV